MAKLLIFQVFLKYLRPCRFHNFVLKAFYYLWLVSKPTEMLLTISQNIAFRKKPII